MPGAGSLCGGKGGQVEEGFKVTGWWRWSPLHRLFLPFLPFLVFFLNLLCSGLCCYFFE